MVEAILKMALIAAMWELGSVSSNLMRMRRGFVEGTLECPVIFALIMRWCCANWYRAGVRERYAGRTTLVVHHAGDVVLLAKSMDAAQTMVSESIPELESTGQSVGAEKTHWTSFSRMELEGVGRHPFVRVLLSLSVARSIVMMSSESNCV